MFVAEVTFRCPTAKSDTQQIIHALNGLLSALRMNGQILGREFPLAGSDLVYRTFLMLPAADSLETLHANEYVGQCGLALTAAGLSQPDIVRTSEDPTSAPACTCDTRATFNLYTNFLSIESPLRCGECCGPVPLYAIPPTRNGEYDDIISWQSDYQACDTLQMNCRTGERFALREMGHNDSSLSRQGRACCEAIEAVSGVPTYYYLYRYYGKSLAEEHKRRCPGCGGDWLLPEQLHGLFDFRCPECRLLSNIKTASQNS